MSLRKQTLLIIALTSLGLIGALYLFSQSILLKSYIALENEQAQQNVQRALDALNEEIAALNRSAGDYAAWDDTYAYVQGDYPDYPKINLIQSTFTEIDLDLLVILNTSGAMLFARQLDLEHGREVPLSDDLKHLLSADSRLLRHSDPLSSISGIVLLPEAPMLIASRPVVTGEYQGPIRGTLIMGRYLDDRRVQHLADVTHLALSVYPARDAQLPADVGQIRSLLTADNPIQVQPVDEQLIAGYALLTGVDGQPALILKAEMPRHIYQQGRNSLTYFLLAQVIASLVFTGVLLLLLERRVLARLGQLSTSVNRIATSGDLHLRTELSGQDELSGLANAINSMLEALEQAQAALRKHQEELEKRVEERTARLTRANTLMKREIAERKRAQNEISRHLEIEQTLARVVARFVRIEDFDSAVREALRDIGQLSRSSRAYLFLFSEDDNAMLNTHEWCAEGVPSCLHATPPFNTADFPWWMRCIASPGGFVYIEDTENLPANAQAEKDLLQRRQARSVLALPVQVDAELLGFLGLEHVRSPGSWAGEDVYVLQIVALNIGKALQHKRAQDALERQRTFLRQVMDASPNLVFATDRAGCFTLANQAFASLFGVTAESMVGRPVTDFVRDGQQAAILARRNREMLDNLQESQMSEEWISDASGRVRRFQAVRRLISAPDGKSCHVLCIAHEIEDAA